MQVRPELNEAVEIVQQGLATVEKRVQKKYPAYDIVQRRPSEVSASPLTDGRTPAIGCAALDLCCWNYGCALAFCFEVRRRAPDASRLGCAEVHINDRRLKSVCGDGG